MKHLSHKRKTVALYSMSHLELITIYRIVSKMIYSKDKHLIFKINFNKYKNQQILV